MSALKELISHFRDGGYEKDVAGLQEISDRLDKLEKQSVSVVSQSPVADLKDIPEGTIYTGDTEEQGGDDEFRRREHHIQALLIEERDDLRARLAEAEKENTALKQRIIDENKAHGFELRDPNGTIWEVATDLKNQNDELQRKGEELCCKVGNLIVERDEMKAQLRQVDDICTTHFISVQDGDYKAALNAVINVAADMMNYELKQRLAKYEVVK